MEDTDNMQTLLDNWNEIESGIYKKNRGKSDGATFHKEFYPDTTEEELREARKIFEEQLKLERIQREFLEFEKEKSEQMQESSRARDLENQKIDEAYEAIMEPIFNAEKAEKSESSEDKRLANITFGVWLSRIELTLSEIVHPENYSMLTKEEKKRIIAEQAKRPGNPLTYEQIHQLFNQLYEEKEEREREREGHGGESNNESLEELYGLYKIKELTSEKARNFKRILNANPNIDTSFILDTKFTPFAKAIGLDASTIKNIRKNRFKKKWLEKGGKTKRRKNKKTKRRKNKKTKRRK